MAHIIVNHISSAFRQKLKPKQMIPKNVYYIWLQLLDYLNYILTVSKTIVARHTELETGN